MSIFLGGQLLAGVATNTISNAHTLLDFKWTDHLLNDQSWLRADTFSWQDGTVYSNAYNHLVADYNGGTSQTETVGSYTITYVLATDGHKITTDETTVQNIYNESGVAWYYILDTANQRFKLPRENPAHEELIQVVRAKGNGITLGLTDGTNNLGLQNGTNPYKVEVSSGSYNKNVGTASTSNSSNVVTLGLTTDSTKSGIISDMTESTSVYKGKQYLYFYVGQFSQTATEQTAGLNSELFNGKMDRNMSNMNPSQTAKETITGWGMPDYSAGISLTNGQVYTPSVNGIFIISAYGTWAVAAVHLGTSVDGVELGINRSNSNDANGRASVTVFANAGETYYIRATPTAKATFYPMKGANNA